MKSNNTTYIDNALAILEPAESLTFADWVEKYVSLPAESTAESGYFRCDRTPYVRGVYDSLQSTYIENVSLIWGRQCAKTSTIFNYILFIISQDPGPILYLMPTVDLAEFTSKTRLQPVIDSCRIVNSLKTDNLDDYTRLEMKFKTCSLSISGVGSAIKTMSKPARILVRDELDQFQVFSGKKDIDLIKSSEECTTTFSNRKIINTSTPTSEDGHIWREMSTSEYVFEYWIPCPSCNEYQLLYFQNIKFPNRDYKNTYYECICKYHISNDEKNKMLKYGEWNARCTENPCQDILDSTVVEYSNVISLKDVLNDHSVKKISFHLPKWYSPFQNATLNDCAKEFLEAQGDYIKILNWNNFWAAKPYVERIKTKKYSDLLSENKIDIEPLICPENTKGVICTIDHGKNIFYYIVCAYTDDNKIHTVDYGSVSGWVMLENLIFNNCYQVQGKDYKYHIFRTGIDTGGTHIEGHQESMTEEVYNWLLRNRRNNLFGVKGFASISKGRRMNLNVIDKMPSGSLIKGSIAVWQIDVNAYKDSLWYYINNKYLTFHSNVDEYFLSSILSEEKIRDRDGKLVWKQKHKNNHFLDCLVYNISLSSPECYGGTGVLTMPVKNNNNIQNPQNNNTWLSGIDKL